ncbi:MAG: CoA-binding protein [Anaerolineales bacterium]|nr:CoA-binding protein [Anaerolineales bacterium]
MLLNERMAIGHAVLKQSHTFAVVGVSQDKQKYGYEVFEALKKNGYKVYPVNPKYASVDEQTCYSSLQALPEKPDVVVTAIPPAVTEKVAETCAQLNIETLWMPPETWSEKAVEICQAQGGQEIHDLCLVFALRSLK